MPRRPGRTQTRRWTHPRASARRSGLEAGRPDQTATDGQVRRLLGDLASRTPTGDPLPAIIAALGWNDSLRRLDDCRRGTDLRLSADEEPQDQVRDAGGALLAD